MGLVLLHRGLGLGGCGRVLLGRGGGRVLRSGGCCRLLRGSLRRVELRLRLFCRRLGLRVGTGILEGVVLVNIRAEYLADPCRRVGYRIAECRGESLLNAVRFNCCKVSGALSFVGLHRRGAAAVFVKPGTGARDAVVDPSGDSNGVEHYALAQYLDLIESAEYPGEQKFYLVDRQVLQGDVLPLGVFDLYLRMAFQPILRAWLVDQGKKFVALLLICLLKAGKGW